MARAFATVEEVDAAIQAAQDAFASWRQTPIQARMRIMLKLQDLIRANMKEIAQVLTAEQGKPWQMPKVIFNVV